MKIAGMISVLLLLMAAPSLAQQRSYTFKCDWISTREAYSNNVHPTTGSKTITIETNPRALTKEGIVVRPITRFSGENLIHEIGPYKIGQFTHAERIVINRFTGEIQNTVVVGGSAAILSGKCKLLGAFIPEPRPAPEK
jgi:hypothetical protein